MRNMASYRLLLFVGVLTVAIFSLNTFGVLPAAVVSIQPQQPLLQSAFATFPGENGKIAFASSRDGDFNIYIMSADGFGATRLTNHPDSDRYPDMSPNGKKIVFHSHRDGNVEIYVMSEFGFSQTRLTNNADFDGVPSWSPDGKKIVFESNRDGNSEIYVMNADGSGQTRLTNHPNVDSFANWSPDGKKIAFTSNRDGDFEIYVMNADGSGSISKLTDNSADDTQPDWSPDGKRITFVRIHSPTNHDVYVMNLLTRPPLLTKLTFNPDNDLKPSWSPDGKKIVFESNRDGNSEIYVMNADGTSPKRLTDNSAADYEPDWGSTAVTTILVEAIDQLLSIIQNSDNVPQSVKTSFTALLKETSVTLNDSNPANDESACGKLGAFINQINANERRGSLTAIQAEDLRTQAEDIRDMLGC